MALLITAQLHVAQNLEQPHFSAGKEVHNDFRIANAHYCTHNSMPLVPILSQTTQVHTLTPCLLKTRLYIHLRQGLSSGPCHHHFPTEFLNHFPCVLHVTHIALSFISTSSYFRVKITYYEAHHKIIFTNFTNACLFNGQTRLPSLMEIRHRRYTASLQ